MHHNKEYPLLTSTRESPQMIPTYCFLITPLYKMNGKLVVSTEFPYYSDDDRDHDDVC